jgi:hypothetical protein
MPADRLSDREIEAVLVVASDVSPGPIYVVHQDQDYAWLKDSEGTFLHSPLGMYPAAAEYFSAAHTLLPRALTELATTRKALSALRAKLNALADQHDAEATRLAYAKGHECNCPLSNAHDDFCLEIRELLEGR